MDAIVACRSLLAEDAASHPCRAGRVGGALADSCVQCFGIDGESIRQLELGRLRRTQASDSDVALPLANCLSGMTLRASFDV